MRIPTWFARRFVAGETPESAVRVGRELNARGIRATFDLLGEDVLDRDAARRCAEANMALLRLIPPEVERNVSVKLSNLGLDISRKFCEELVAGVLEAAREVQGFVRIDMEGSRHTQATLEVFQSLRRRHENVGIVLQAYLRRTQDDVAEAVKRADRVRLCKGAYKEPEKVAFKSMDEIRASFRRCARLLLDGQGHAAVATHDEGLIQDALAFVKEKAVPQDRFEFQMLYGLRPRRWDELVRAGHGVRIYVPYGSHWFPYFYRRLRERKENVFFVLKSLLGG
jgi:proline dehydrogenase